jgi:hypothetical protein
MREIYRPLYLNQTPLIFVTGRRTRELIKYAANAFLAMKITFINEMADLCEKVDADVQDVARGIGLDNRIGRNSSCRPRLWRLLLPQGHARAGQDRPGLREQRRPASDRDGGRGQRPAQEAHGREGHRGLRRLCRRQDHRACSA